MNRRERVLRYLAQDEPEYEKAAAGLGPRAFPLLEELAASADPLLASKATHLATLIRGPGARAVVEAAARREEAEVRVAAAAAMGSLWPASPLEALAMDAPSGALDRLLWDADAGVRKYALRSATTMGLDDRVDEVLRSNSTDPFLREVVEEERRERP